MNKVDKRRSQLFNCCIIRTNAIHFLSGISHPLAHKFVTPSLYSVPSNRHHFKPQRNGEGGKMTRGSETAYFSVQSAIHSGLWQPIWRCAKMKKKSAYQSSQPNISIGMLCVQNAV